MPLKGKRDYIIPHSPFIGLRNFFFAAAAAAAAQTNRNKARKATPHLELGPTKDLLKTSSTQRTKTLMKEKLWILRDK